MNKNIIEGNWEILKGKIQSEWGDLTDNPTTEELGDEKQLRGYLQKQYGWDEERAEEEYKKVEKMYATLEDEEHRFDREIHKEDERIDKIVDHSSKEVDDIYK